ncbi:hypothetical protein D3C72_1092480 [compost metagenome]
MPSRIRLASSKRPCCASQRGDSGRRLRSHQINSANTALASTTQRQPETPNGACGTSHHDINATAGTDRNCTKNAKAKAELRMRFGTSSER